jgi:hypothetical protein
MATGAEALSLGRGRPALPAPRPTPGIEAWNRRARWAAWGIFGLNFVLLAASLGDYRVSIDSGFHISLAEWYAHHATAWWDHINYGPVGRPNLQGPALHIAIAMLGTALGGRPGDFILANAVLALAQWCAAVGTAFYFARRIGGDVAAMFAVALLAGSGFSSASFYIGVPSGWIFIAVPWALYFFLNDRLILATAVTALGCYAHLGGFLTAPLALLIAAVIEGRWRALAKVGVATAILTLPYSIHFLANLAWYRGRHAPESLRFDTLILLLGVSGFSWIASRPRPDTFLVAWATGPLAWLFQDYHRFILQSSIAASVLGALLLTHLMGRISRERARSSFAWGMVALATLFPLSIPSLAGEISWDAGIRYPRMLNWNEARRLAAIIHANNLNNRLLAVYQFSLGPAIAVFTPVTVEKGHWVEVQPPHDPADDVSAGAKVYVVPLAPDDPELIALVRNRLVEVYGGTADTAVVTLATRAAPGPARSNFVAVVERNAEWLACHAVNNGTPPFADLISLMTAAGRAAYRRRLDAQRFHAGRLEVATLVYAYALEPRQPAEAKRLRLAAMDFGTIASYLSDADPLGRISAARHAQFRRNMEALAIAVSAHPADPSGARAVRSAMRRLFSEYLAGAAA